MSCFALIPPWYVVRFRTVNTRAKTDGHYTAAVLLPSASCSSRFLVCLTAGGEVSANRCWWRSSSVLYDVPKTMFLSILAFSEIHYKHVDLFCLNH